MPDDTTFANWREHAQEEPNTRLEQVRVYAERLIAMDEQDDTETPETIGWELLGICNG